MFGNTPDDARVDAMAEAGERVQRRVAAECAPLPNSIVGECRRHHAVLVAMQKVQRNLRRSNPRRLSEPAGQRDHAAGHRLGLLSRLQRHDRALREADQRGGARIHYCLTLPGAHRLDEARHGCGNARRPIGLGHAAYREPLPALPEVGWIGRAHADHAGLWPLRSERLAERAQILGARAHAVEQKQQLPYRGRLGPLDEKVVAHAHGYLTPPQHRRRRHPSTARRGRCRRRAPSTRSPWAPPLRPPAAARSVRWSGGRVRHAAPRPAYGAGVRRRG
mmetsp:Transcript_5757/g.22348  ORF Transcript_5757/g.22348 Transcript_5757/m.22348 type:complete len:277 (-) Transcript_5757:1518-2348(-)